MYVCKLIFRKKDRVTSLKNFLALMSSASISHEIDFNKTKSKVSRSEQKGSISAIELRPPTRIFSQCETLS